MRKNRRNLSGAFTLVEMLVVIAIIGLLLVIALPSMFSTTEMTRRAICASNIAQLWKASAAYRVDFDNFYPPTQYRGLKGDGEGPGPYTRNQRETPGNPNPSLRQDSNIINPLNGYLGFPSKEKKRRGQNRVVGAEDTIKILVCPSNDWMVRDEDNPEDGTFYRLDDNGVLQRGSLYHFLEYNYEMTENFESRGFRKPRNLAQTILFYDQEDSGANLDLYEGNHRDVRSLFALEDGGVNIGYCDGHARWFPNKQPYVYKNYRNYTGNTNHPYQLIRDDHGYLIRDENGQPIRNADSYRYGDYEGVPYNAQYAP